MMFSIRFCVPVVFGWNVPRSRRTHDRVLLSLSLSLLTLNDAFNTKLYKDEREEKIVWSRSVCFLSILLHSIRENNEQIFFFFFVGGGDENDSIRSPSLGTSKKNKKEKRERDLAKIVRGGVRFAKARVSVLSRRNPSSERNREEIKRRELRVTLRSERIHRRGSDGV